MKMIEVGARRLAIYHFEPLGDWWVGYSPKNCVMDDKGEMEEDGQVEGPWEDWVALAKEILRLDALEESHG